jgi:hypothetical protein
LKAGWSLLITLKVPSLSLSHPKEFSSDDLQSTFSWLTFLNGLVAILSGAMANYSVEHYGLVSPFLLAGSVSIIAFIVISMSWEENYGSLDEEDNSKSNKNDSIWTGIQFILSGTPLSETLSHL